MLGAPIFPLWPTLYAADTNYRRSAMTLDIRHSRHRSPPHETAYSLRDDDRDDGSPRGCHSSRSDALGQGYSKNFRLMRNIDGLASSLSY